MAPMFGKRPARRDTRSLRLGAIVNESSLPPLPRQFDFDDAHPEMPHPAFGNNDHPCCVIAAHAHQTLRFELSEARSIPDITEYDVLTEWRKQTHGAEEGLVVLDSLRRWRREGWRAAGRTYRITAFATVDWGDRERMKLAIYLLHGIGLGLDLPFAVTEHINDTTPWSVPSDPRLARKDPRGGHYALLTGYDEEGPVCVTWGRKQHMTWEFVDRYADEAYALVDGVDPWLAISDSPINVEALVEYLQMAGTVQ